MISLKRRVSGTGATEVSGDGTFRPQITSLVDVMIFMLIFLIKSFSVEGDIVTPSKDLELPTSTSRTPPKPLISIEISRDHIMADGKVLAQTAEVAGRPEMLIDAVYEWVKRQSLLIADTTEKRDVLIQADREAPFDVLKRVMFSCSKAGISDFVVLAIQED